MMRLFAGLLAALIACAGSASAEAPPAVAPGMPVGTGLQPVAIYDAAGNLISSFGGGAGSAGSVTAPGTSGTQAQAVQGINGGVPIATSSSVVDGLANTYTVTATGSQVGVPLAGYGSVLVEVNGGTAQHMLQFSADSTDGVNGTWTTGIGHIPESTTAFAPNSLLDSASQRRRLYRAQDGTWARINTSAFTSGPVTVVVTRRIAPISERAVFVGAIGAGSSVIGSTTIRGSGTNRSGTVGTTAANLMAANGNRQGWKVKNDSAGDIWINFDTAATATPGGGNIKIPSGGYLASEPGFIETGAMSAIGSAAGLAITAREH